MQVDGVPKIRIGSPPQLTPWPGSLPMIFVLATIRPRPSHNSDEKVNTRGAGATARRAGYKSTSRRESDRSALPASPSLSQSTGSGFHLPFLSEKASKCREGQAFFLVSRPSCSPRSSSTPSSSPQLLQC